MSRTEVRAPNRVPQILVQNRQRLVRIPLPELQQFAVRALLLTLAEPARKEARLTNLREVFVLVISDRRMAKLHRDFFHVSGPTDVITFQHGELFISAETPRRQAREFRTTLRQELQLYLVHGLLHLQGFDDTIAKAARRMEATQTRILAALS